MKTFAFYLTCLLLATPAAKAAVSFDLVGPSTTNVDASGGSSISLFASGDGVIEDLNVIVHLFNRRTGGLTPPALDAMAWGDMTVTLSHLGTTVTLWNDGNPGETPDLFVAFDDESTDGTSLDDVLAGSPNSDGRWPTNPAVSGFTSGVFSTTMAGDVDYRYAASEALAAFDGLPLAGEWVLSFSDLVVPDEGDALLGWQLYGEVAPIPLPASGLLLLAGLGAVAGFARARRKT